MNREIALAMGKAGYQKLREDFSIENNNQLIETLYRSIFDSDLRK